MSPYHTLTFYSNLALPLPCPSVNTVSAKHMEIDFNCPGPSGSLVLLKDCTLAHSTTYFVVTTTSFHTSSIATSNVTLVVRESLFGRHKGELMLRILGRAGFRRALSYEEGCGGPPCLLCIQNSHSGFLLFLAT